MRLSGAKFLRQAWVLGESARRVSRLQGGWESAPPGGDTGGHQGLQVRGPGENVPGSGQ